MANDQGDMNGSQAVSNLFPSTATCFMYHDSLCSIHAIFVAFFSSC